MQLRNLDVFQVPVSTGQTQLTSIQRVIGWRGPHENISEPATAFPKLPSWAPGLQRVLRISEMGGLGLQRHHHLISPSASESQHE